MDDFNLARKLLGERAVYRRFVGYIGVPSTGIEHAREQLIRNFADHSLPYFSLASFPQSLFCPIIQKQNNGLAGQQPDVRASCERIQLLLKNGVWWFGVGHVDGKVCFVLLPRSETQSESDKTEKKSYWRYGP
jgi:hypothetical protein